MDIFYFIFSLAAFIGLMICFFVLQADFRKLNAKFDYLLNIYKKNTAHKNYNHGLSEKTTRKLLALLEYLDLECFETERGLFFLKKREKLLGK